MEKLTIEQKVLGSTYTPVGQAQQAKAINLGGFAYSFEDLLQRVGARLDHAFTSTEQAKLFSSSSDSSLTDSSANDHVNRRDSGSDRDDRTHDDRGDNSVRAHESDQRDSGLDHDRGSHEPTTDRADANDRSDGNDQGSRQNDQANNDDSGRDNDVDAKSTDTSEKDDSGQKSDSNSDNNTAETGNASGDADSNTTPQAAAVTAAAIYSASKSILGNGEKTTTVDAATAQQSLRGNEGAQAAAGQIAAKQSNNPGDGSKANNHQTANNGGANTAVATQKAADGANSGKVDALQTQAQQLSRAIGPETQGNIKVSINNEQAQVTSKPSLTMANTSILAQDGGKSSQNNQQQAGQQQAGTQGQSAQQLQAAQQLAQATQQANNQAGQQAKATGPTGPSNTPSSVQSVGSAQQNGGPDALNNLQNANTGQTTQQTQQNRDTQAQQQTQTAQRNQLSGSAVTEQISVKITKALQSGTDRITIQLKPAELGRVDVKLEMTSDGRVMTVVTAEKQDTLDLLRRDSSELQRALQEAGLKTGDMEFNLKGQEQQSADGENADNSTSSGQETAADDSNPDELDAGIVNAWESGIFLNGRLDVRA